MSKSIEEKSTELINDIQNLQTIEMDLFANLEKGLANITFTEDDKKNLVDQINKISTISVQFFSMLHAMNEHYQGTVSNSGNVINQQLNAVIIVENELNESKARVKRIEEDKNNKLRLVEINTYYGEKYADHADIMKTVVYFCIPLILLALLANMNILPGFIYKILMVIILFFAVIIIGWKLIIAMSHDNMNYQEYIWGTTSPSSTTSAPPVDTSNSSGTNPWFSTGATCVAQECCDTGFTYVPSPTNKCVSNETLPEGVVPYNASQSVSASVP